MAACTMNGPGQPPDEELGQATPVIGQPSDEAKPRQTAPFKIDPSGEDEKEEAPGRTVATKSDPPTNRSKYRSVREALLAFHADTSSKQPMRVRAPV